MFVGYTALKATVLTNTLGLSLARKIALFDVRVVAALCEMQAIRFAARCCGSVKEPRYTVSELSRLTGCPNESLLRRSLSRLQREGILLEFSETAIILSSISLDAALPTLEAANRTRTGKLRNSFRKIPVPRTMLRFIAKCPKKAHVCGLLAYLLQCFSFGANGLIKTIGCVKSSRIAEIAGIALSSAKRVRAWLIDIGWLVQDTGSNRRKQNRTGAYCHFDLEKILSGSELSHPPTEIGSELSHPYKDTNLPTESKNQNLDLIPPTLLPTLGKKPGVCKQMDKPSIHNVVAPDLKHLDRLETLYIDAVKRNLVPHTPLSKIDFVAAAIRARAVEADEKGNAVRLFCGIVRKKLNHVISNAQEDLARAWILKERGSVTLFAEDLPDLRARNPLEASQKGDRCPGTPVLPNEQKTTQKPRMGISVQKTLSVSPERLVRSPVPPAEAKERQPCRLSELLKAKVRENRAKAKEKAEESWDNQPLGFLSRMFQAVRQQVRTERQQMNTG